MKNTLFRLVAGLTLSSAALFLSGCGPASNSAETDSWPTKPITISCFAAAGGGTDLISRMVAQAMEPELGVKVNVINRTGGRGGAAINHVWSRPRDGYEWGGFSESVIPASVLGITETTTKDWAYFMVAGAPGVISVAPDSPFKSLEDLVAALKANPKSVKAAAGLTGGLWHTKLLALEEAAGVQFQFIPYKGSQPSQLAVLTQEVDVVLTSISEQAELIRGGRVRPLAMVEMAPKELDGFGTIPAAGVNYPGLSALPVGQFLGFALPADTPTDILARITSAFEKIMQDKELISYCDEQLLDLMGIHGEESLAMTLKAERVWTWKLHELGITVKSPADLGIARP
ncbi:tripartite tricarboxylate transporter substrate binding protein [Pelagicoccus sp. SDUM812005]|uniref:Bug family tripartite tricarboxylate transporter substrate binding protein n=1 Tax=Pelagicoccus sp. SDUM812005 TaxID=3041257 RepID=UPI00280C6C40|nr:tripartite tricarboxylate transporter substrate binding protein [Pelagicoccus sp. SDUM812005]MDQ8180628.1 tripartite tricarboxylate transporter substrate binding protein [Pelagicoccus sp. SDUM812005]